MQQHTLSSIHEFVPPEIDASLLFLGGMIWDHTRKSLLVICWITKEKLLSGRTIDLHSPPFITVLFSFFLFYFFFLFSFFLFSFFYFALFCKAFCLFFCICVFILLLFFYFFYRYFLFCHRKFLDFVPSWQFIVKKANISK